MLDWFKYILSKVLKKSLNIPAIKNCDIDKSARVCSGTHIVNSTMNRYSYIGNFCSVVNTKIGSFCSIADYCIIGGANHPMNWVSTSPVFHEGKNILNKNFSEFSFNPYLETKIGNDVWIGARCLIKSGISIGDGSIIGMGSVVTRDVEPYTIVAGVPAKLIRKRFDDETIEKLLDTKWWNLSNQKIENISRHMNNIDAFLENFNKEQE